MSSTPQTYCLRPLFVNDVRSTKIRQVHVYLHIYIDLDVVPGILLIVVMNFAALNEIASYTKRNCT